MFCKAFKAFLLKICTCGINNYNLQHSASTTVKWPFYGTFYFLLWRNVRLPKILSTDPELSITTISINCCKYTCMAHECIDATCHSWVTVGRLTPIVKFGFFFYEDTTRFGSGAKKETHSVFAAMHPFSNHAHF